MADANVTVSVDVILGEHKVSTGQISALADIIGERNRQINELGYTTEHDDTEGLTHLVEQVEYWMWHGNTRVELVKAAALLVAAIELLDREAAVTAEPTS